MRFPDRWKYESKINKWHIELIIYHRLSISRSYSEPIPYCCEGRGVVCSFVDLLTLWSVFEQVGEKCVAFVLVFRTLVISSLPKATLLCSGGLITMALNQSDTRLWLLANQLRMKLCWQHMILCSIPLLPSNYSPLFCLRFPPPLFFATFLPIIQCSQPISVLLPQHKARRNRRS